MCVLADWLAEIKAFSVLARENGLISMSKCQRPRLRKQSRQSAADWLKKIKAFFVLAAMLYFILSKKDLFIMKFTKMHGLGNDFIVLENIKQDLSLTKEQIAFLCDRKFGIGADGLIIINPSQMHHIKMSFYNSDGTEVEMCGNGIRCFAKYVYDKNIIRENPLYVETLAGLKITYLEIQEDIVTKVEVNMGKAIFECSKIPMYLNQENALDEKLSYNGQEISYTALSMGNPHVVILVTDVEHYPVKEVGAFFENHPLFPSKTNVNFVEVVNQNHIKVITWERGAGLTLACGTGACASARVAVLKGLVKEEISATLPGGDLRIKVKDDIYMTGDAVEVFSGEITL